MISERNLNRKVQDAFDVALFQSIVEQVLDMIIISNTLGEILYANKAASNAYGYSGEEFSRLRIHDLCMPETLYHIESRTDMARQKGIRFRTDNLRKNGEAFPVEINYQCIAFEEKEVFISTIKDITQIIAIESEMNEQENKYRLLQEALRVSDEKLARSFYLSPDAVAITRLKDGLFIDVNRGFTQIIGYAREETIGKTVVELNIWVESQEREYMLERLKQYGEVQHNEFQFRHKNGESFYGLMSVMEIDINDEACLMLVVRDITERKQMEKSLQVSEEKFSEAFHLSPDSMSINRICDGIYLDVNKSFLKLVGLTRNEIIGKAPQELWFGKIAQSSENLPDRMNKHREVRNMEVQMPDRKGGTIHGLRSTSMIHIAGEACMLSIVRDITERKRIEEEMKHLSLHDALTGLYNRAFFEDRMKKLLTMQNGFVGLLIGDVDGLKIVNDTLGHSKGDAVLKSVANILKNSFRPEDTVARIGGDEFAVILVEASEKELTCYRHRIYEQIKSYNAENTTIPISMSIGYAVARKSPIDTEVLFREADNNMYREKLHQQQSARSAIVQALMKALEARDYLTEGHGDRLQDLVQKFAEKVGLPENSIPDFRLFAHFHDIGKVGIPDSILFKAGSLTAEEWIVMRSHCEIGHRIAIVAPELADIADWIYKHHEWWNGSGYPLGLKGDEIPFVCRMLAIADAYDAMTSDRPYRKAMSCEAAVSELKRFAGTQFDPELVEKFVSTIEFKEVL